MPSGLMPTYRYRPAVSGDPAMRTRSTRRARLWAGGTYFRAREPGGKGNNISIEAQEWTELDDGGNEVKKGKVIITNHNTLYDENVVGPVTVDLLDQNLNWNERYTIEEVDGTPHALKYSISLQIAVGAALEQDLGVFAFSDVLHVPDKLSAKLTPKLPEWTLDSVITIKPRTRVYDLVEKTVTPEAEGGEAPAPTPTTGWDIQALRDLINENDPWIEMRPRTPTPETPEGGGVPLAGPKIDAQDDGKDDTFLTAFADIYLAGGDGLPDVPSGERTGPSRSIVHINYGERYDGTLAEVNEVYEWVGDTAKSGEWKKY